MKAEAIIVAGGSGSRMGKPKQFLPLAGKAVVEWSLEAFLSIPEVERVVLVTSPENIREHGSRLFRDRVVLVPAGPTRMGSVRNGFEAVSQDAEMVAVHDGARALVTPEIIRATLDEAYESGAAVPAVQVKDTLKKVTNKQMWISDTPARSSFWAAQTPQCYRREVLQEALARFPDAASATDESQLVEKCGQKVRVVPSSYENFKITTPEDLIMAEALLEQRQGGRRRTAVGLGWDIHRLVAGRELWLAGTQLAGAKGLLGHSDADVVLHAAADAVLGALGAGEIGMMFPPDDPKFKGIASRKIVAEVLKRLRSASGSIANLDVTIVAEEPKMKPHYKTFQKSLAEVFELPAERVNVKAKSHEGLGEIGRGEAIACHAVAVLLLP
ncbi:MAG TPA: bifunctional 2-C-methyl-D-erythritol 4-phosphate cytidylyltransferase/2-C-methyl-D-erythritol 2,4-cyclodiphosphate synthase [Elusimicrobia bacterium]|nr:bifunctional 2-C-methyl-D-erythritol 4-phosphate cytidylyltransferase/2-C-methyl-D-erythritol 2,4-cyclodiphosphate synthase [Elusimicrobiota bacterium]HBT60638.1 bifunctional 2-C-methyl-D-erythritol 4-phosphate cytidylyltransferase/2-C-methyl-D-erythritol 2,4-cyclodiphosphate synthase [Elusimicrobiota bacterium]